MTTVAPLGAVAVLLLTAGCVTVPGSDAAGSAHSPFGGRAERTAPAPLPAEDLTPPTPREDLTPASPPAAPPPLPASPYEIPATPPAPAPKGTSAPPHHPRSSPPSPPPRRGEETPVRPGGLTAGCDLALRSAPDLHHWCRELYSGL